MFGTILTAFFTFMLIYVLWRVSSIPFVVRILPRWILIPIGLVLWAVFYFGRFFGHGGQGKLAAVVEYGGMNCLGVIFLVFVTMLAVDLVTVFGIVLPRWAPTLRAGALVMGTLLAAFALIQGHRAPVVVRYEIPLKGLPADLDGTVLVAVSDTHLGKLLAERWLQARVLQIRALSPDIIALVGDIFEGHGEPADGLVATLSGLSAPLGKWYVSGNHEGYGNRLSAGQVLERAGFNSLDDTWQEILPGLVLAGVSDLTSYYRRG
ncbi:MAG: metallophosphoesterase, partial [Pseudomonadota bacterium]